MAFSVNLGSNATISDVLDNSAQQFASRAAIVDGSNRVTYEDLQRRVLGIAGGLAELGVGKGDRVAIWLPNCLEWVVAFFAIVRLGAIAVPVNMDLSVGEAEYLIRQSGSSTLFIVSEFRSRDYIAAARAIQRDLDVTVELVVVGRDTTDGLTRWADLASKGSSLEPSVELSPDDPALILYTSGTTGLPKGAVHSSRFVPSLLATAERIRLTDQDCLVLYLPLHHVYALMAGLMMMTAVGAKVVLMPRFRGSDSLELIARERGSVIYGVPTTYIDQLNDPNLDRHDLSSVRLSITPFPLDLCQRVQARFGRCANSYGMTETASIAFMPSADDPQDVAIATAGRVLPGLDARLVDETSGKPVPPGGVGVLLLRGAAIMRGYYDKPDETARVLDPQGWFRTGDLARFDTDGRLIFIGRQGDQFRVGGEVVDPVEVESALQRHPAVERAAVLGVPDDRLGHVACAWVQLRDDAQVDVTELAQFVSTKLARFKLPRQILIEKRLPTTASGKVQKFRLRENLGSVGHSVAAPVDS